MQDPGLSDNRLLGRLVEAGTIVLDARDDVRFASAGACDLFGVRDEAQLRAAWPAFADRLGVARWPRELPGDSAFHGRADVATARGPRAIRYEMHVVAAGGGHRVVLVRDRGCLLPSDRALLLASEAQANRHVLTGLVHAAKGPLNNFNLTLALLAASAAREGPDAAARRRRYVDVLQAEAARLAGYVDEVHALTLAHAPAHEPIDVGALTLDCARVLRHGATMREVTLDVDVPPSPLRASGDPQLVRLALLSFAIALIELTAPGGNVGWRVASDGSGAAVQLVLTTSQPRLPRALAAGLFRLACTAESEYCAAIAARLVIEAQGGDVVIQDDDRLPAGILLRLPMAA